MLTKKLVEDLDLALLPEEIRNAFLIKACEYFEAHPRVALPVFAAKIKTAPVNAIEIVTFFESWVGKNYILLSKRPDNDPDFAGLWHSPGTTLLNRMGYERAFKELSSNHETGLRSETPSVYAGTVNLPNKPRAHYVCHVFVRKLFGSELPKLSNPNAAWIPLNEYATLPLVGSHKDKIIPMAFDRLAGISPVFIEDVSDTDK